MKTTKKNQRGFTHNIALLALGVLVLGIVGFAGFKVYKSKDSAGAYNWYGGRANTTTNEIQLYMCQTGRYTGYIYARNRTSNTFTLKAAGGFNLTVYPNSNSPARAYGFNDTHLGWNSLRFVAGEVIKNYGRSYGGGFSVALAGNNEQIYRC